MICISCTPRLKDRRSSSLAGRLAGTIRRAWRAYWDWRARKATLLLLRALDERTLRDIGLNTDDIACLAKYERFLQHRVRRRYR